MGEKIKFIGHAAFALCDASARVYIDPAISIVGGNVKEHHPTAILLTHGHGDHVGDTVQLLRENPDAKVYAIVELATLISKDLEGKPDSPRCIGVNKGGCVAIGHGWTATLVDAKHSSSYNDAFAGEAAGWVVRTASGTTIYHTGDTDVFPGMDDIACLHRPNVALMCIGGHYTMGPKTAAYAISKYFKGDHAPVVIPMHFGTWPILAGTPDQLKEELKALGADNSKVRAMTPGEEAALNALL